MQSVNVPALTDSTLEAALEKYDYVFCLFLGPNNAPCGTTRASFNHTADQLVSQIPNVGFGTLDCNTQKESATKYNISSENYHITKVLSKTGSDTIEGFLTKAKVSDYLKKQNPEKFSHLE